MRLLIVVLITWLCQACASTSSMLNIIHTERETRVGNWFIVVDKVEFSNWVTEFKQNPEIKVIGEDTNFILALDNYGDGSSELWMVSYQVFTDGFCSEMENIKETPEYENQFKENGIVINSVDSVSIENCNNSYQTFYELVNEDGSYRGKFSAVIMFNITLTSELKYKYTYAGSQCRDGTTSSSSGKGTCSWHGGVSGPYYRKVYLH